MCLAVPMKIESVDGHFASVSVGDVKRNVGLTLTPDAAVGDYVLVHAGYAIKIINEEEAQETIRLLNEIHN